MSSGLSSGQQFPIPPPVSATNSFYSAFPSPAFPMSSAPLPAQLPGAMPHSNLPSSSWSQPLPTPQSSWSQPMGSQLLGSQPMGSPHASWSQPMGSQQMGAPHASWPQQLGPNSTIIPQQSQFPSMPPTSGFFPPPQHNQASPVQSLIAQNLASFSGPYVPASRPDHSSISRNPFSTQQ